MQRLATTTDRAAQLLGLLGFESLVVSDGVGWAHRIDFE